MSVESFFKSAEDGDYPSKTKRYSESNLTRLNYQLESKFNLICKNYGDGSVCD